MDGADNALEEIARDSLVSFPQHGHVGREHVDRLLHQRHAAHASYNGVMIWIAMRLEQWLSARD